jgi:hypothetical protein
MIRQRSHDRSAWAEELTCTFRRRSEGPPSQTEKARNPPFATGFVNGRYWARTSDPQLVELVLSQLS